MSFSNAFGIVSCHHKGIWQSQDMSRTSTLRILGASCHDPHACLEGIFFHHMYLLYLLPLPSEQPPKYCTVRTYLFCHLPTLPTLPDGRRMPKVSSFVLRAESVRIKPLQRLPTVCTISLTPKGEHHIRPTLLPRPVLHLILVNLTDNLVCLCFFQFKSAFEQIWVRSLDWVVCP